MFSLIFDREQPPTFHFWLEWSKALAPVAGAAIAVLGVIGTIVWSLRKGKIDAKYQYASKMLEMRVKQLSDFYAPMKVQLEQSRALYQKLKWAIDRIGREDPNAKIPLDGFRLLDHGYTILHDDRYALAKPLVEGILDIGKAMSKLIVKNSGLIEGGMTATFTEYRAHFLMLEASLKTPPSATVSDGWQEFGYYPRMLNREVAEGFKEVLRHCEMYQQAGDDVIWELLERIPKPRREAFRALMDTLRYYEANAEAYAQSFDSFDGIDLRGAFLAEVQKQKGDDTLRILDAGCGTGRDASRFIDSGYVVNAFDASPAMVRLCSRKIRELSAKGNEVATKSSCSELTFDELSERNGYNGVWASASLLHVSKADLPEVIDKLAGALKPNGTIFMSFKYGKSETQFDSRHFSSFSKNELTKLVSKVSSLTMTDIWISDGNGKRVSYTSSLGEGFRIALGGPPRCWINILAKRSISR